jgi:hypothetical protein
VLRIGRHILSRSLLDNLAEVHDHDSIGHVPDSCEVVTNEKVCQS